VAAAVVITGWDSGGFDRRSIGSHTGGSILGSIGRRIDRRSGWRIAAAINGGSFLVGLGIKRSNSGAVTGAACAGLGALEL